MEFHNMLILDDCANDAWIPDIHAKKDPNPFKMNVTETAENYYIAHRSAFLENADEREIKSKLENGVLKICVPKKTRK